MINIEAFPEWILNHYINLDTATFLWSKSIPLDLSTSLNIWHRTEDIKEIQDFNQLKLS